MKKKAFNCHNNFLNKNIKTLLTFWFQKMNICPFGIASNLSGIMTFTVYSADTATEYKVEPSMSEILPGSTEEHILSLVETGISLNFLVFNCIFWQIIGLLLYYVLTKFIKHYVGSTLESFKGPEIFFILGLQSCILMKLSLTSMELSANSLPKKEFVDLLPAFCSYKLSFNDWCPLILRVDTISIYFILLTFIVFWGVYLYFFLVEAKKLANIETKIRYLLLLSFTQLALIIIFSCINLFYFYVLFEILLLLMNFLIGGGNSLRKFRAIKFFVVYSVIGSLFILAALMIIIKNFGFFPTIAYLKYSSWGAITFMGLTLSSKVIVILLLAIGLAFKIPLPPFHGWLIEAHVESNTIGSMLLAGLVLKLAYIGYVRFIFYPFASLLYCGLTPDSNLSSLESQSILFLKNFQSIFSLWLLVAAVYITLLLFVQNDAKKFIAYTSIAHMTFSTASLFNTSQNFGFFAALFTSIAHGIVATMFFCLFGMIYERFKTRDISAISGLALTNPSFSNFFLFVTLANVGFPVTFNFIGELNSYFSFLSFFPNDSGDLNVFSLAYSLIVLLLLFGLFFFSGVAALSFFVKVVFGTPKSISSKELYGPTVGEKAILLFYSFWVFFSNLFFFFIPPMLSIF